MYIGYFRRGYLSNQRRPWWLVLW